MRFSAKSPGKMTCLEKEKPTMLNQLTVGQVEREITNQVRSFYASGLGIRCGQIICHFFDTKLVITIEKALSPLEKFFLSQGETPFAEETRLRLDRMIKSAIKDMIEDILGQTVIDVIISSALTIEVTSIMVILQEIPAVRNPEAIPKFRIQEN